MSIEQFGKNLSMKILLIVDDYMPYSIKVAAKMMHELACEFQHQGHEVTVLTPYPKQKTKSKITQLDGVNICSFRSGEIKNVNKAKRAINETLLSYYAWSSFKAYFQENRHDLIIYYSPSIFWGSLVNKLKKLWNCPSYLILRDIFPQWAIDNEILKENSVITKYFKHFEKVSYDAADIIGVMSQKNLDWFQTYYPTNKPLQILYNWASLTPVTNIDNRYKRKLGIEDKIVYFYGGNLGHAQDMMNLMRLAINMKNEPKAHFVFVGAGDEFDLIEKTIEIEMLSNTTLLPSVNQIEYKQMLAEFDVGLFSLNKHHKTHNFPGKLLGYMVQKLPILGSINPDNDLKEVIKNAGAGYIFVNGEDEELFLAAKKLLSHTLRDEMGNNAQKLLIEKFSVNAASKQIFESIS